MSDLPAIAKELIRAAKMGLVKDVRRLVRYPETDEWLEHALMEAVFAGKRAIDVVHFLAPKCDASQALAEIVSVNATKEIVELLLPHSNPFYQESAALRWAAQAGNVDVVAMLLPKSDPKACSSVALQEAAERGHEATIALLAPVSDVEAAWKGLARKYLKHCTDAPRHDLFTSAADHLCDFVSTKTLLKYAEDYPEAWARRSKIRARVASLKLDRATPPAKTKVVQRARL